MLVAGCKRFDAWGRRRTLPTVAAAYSGGNVRLVASAVLVLRALCGIAVALA